MKLRRALVVLLFAAACGNKAPAPVPIAQPAAPAPAAAVPMLATQVSTVADATVLLGEDVAAPQVLVRVSADGSLAVADVPDGSAWSVLDTASLASRGVPFHGYGLAMRIREAVALGQDIEPRMRSYGDVSGVAPEGEDEALLELTRPAPSGEVDDSDESGGTGTAMSLDEGRMGAEDPAAEQLARKEAIEQARAAGVLATGDGFGAGRGGFGFGSDRTEAPDAAWPTRAISAVGRRARTPEKLAAALIVAAPQAKAAPIIDLLAPLEDTYLAVAHDGRLRALRVGYGLHMPGGVWGGTVSSDLRWIEVRFGADGLTVEAVPSPAVTVPWTAGPLATAALAKAYADAHTTIGEARLDVDVLVAPDTDMQHLVDVLAALDAAGAEIIVLGHAPAPRSLEAAKRGQRMVQANLGQPTAMGDLDKAIIRRHIKEALPQLKACYETALATNPSLGGTVTAQFFISPSGAVKASTAAGVDAKVASCVAAVIKRITFPKPKGGGGVTVNYPFVFRN